MRDECSSGIFIFTADEKFLRESKGGEMTEVWRPSENVVLRTLARRPSSTKTES